MVEKSVVDWAGMTAYWKVGLSAVRMAAMWVLMRAVSKAAK